MAELFEKTSIKSLDLENRFIRSATWSGVGDGRGYVTDHALRLYSTLARGGIGLIVTGFQYVLPNGIAMRYQLGNYEDGQTQGLTRLVDAVHEHGGKVAAQLAHTGAKANPDLFPTPGEIWGPSEVPDPLTGRTPKAMTTDQIQFLTDAYAAAAGRCREAGFDAIQLHAAHGYGFNQFLSPFANRRTDDYGGAIGGRYRILGETLKAVRRAVGGDFPIMVKLSGHDYADGGLVPEESLEIARRLQDDGIDAIEVSAGSRASADGMMPSRLKIARSEQEGYLADLAERFKNAVDVPIITVGGVRSPDVAEEILHLGKADYIALSRPLIREPGLINRWKAGDRGRATCISCNGCFETALDGVGVCCKIDRDRNLELAGEDAVR